MSELKERTISFRCSEEEFKIIENKAKDAKLKKSTYITQKCTTSGEIITPKVKSTLCKIQSLITKADNGLTTNATALKEIGEEIKKTWQSLS